MCFGRHLEMPKGRHLEMPGGVYIAWFVRCAELSFEVVFWLWFDAALVWFDVVFWTISDMTWRACDGLLTVIWTISDDIVTNELHLVGFIGVSRVARTSLSVLSHFVTHDVMLGHQVCKGDLL